MKKIKIRGGPRLAGEVNISGAKNAALPLLCAALLTEDVVAFSNIPLLDDISTMLRLLRQIGVFVSDAGESVELCSEQIQNPIAPYELVQMMRASILVLGPLLARSGYARVSLPGGCQIGARPVDQHIKGLKAMGAEISIEHGFIEARVAGRLRGAHIVTDMVTVTGTENLLMAAVLAEGQTVIENAACEPEVSDLVNLLSKMGAKIQGIGTNRLVIEGVQCLRGATHSIIPDRIEAGTFLCAAAATKGDVVLRKVMPTHLSSVVSLLRKAGAIFSIGSDHVRISCERRLAPIFCETAVYPYFPTDMQAQFMALASISSGISYIVEKIFENRFMHVQELNRLGANIAIDGNCAMVHGVEHLSGADVTATDLRASASLVIAGLVADGETSIDGIGHLDRGYANIEAKLGDLGANIKRLSSLPVMADQSANDSMVPMTSAVALGMG